MRRRSASDARPAGAWWVCAGLVLAILLIYAQTGGHPFINFDDPQYVAENPRVLAGMTPASVAWAWTATHAGNWHPLTWLSHMADVELFGADPGGHHLVSVALHAANAVLLFLVLHMTTGALWRSATVAAFFAVHPAHVESVAWIAERKDVLSTLFWLLAMMAYARYARRPTRPRYLLVAASMAAGLLAKPMVVTLPFVLLLMDYWPLGRAARLPAGRLVLEKLPLFALSLASAAVTFTVQREAGAVRALDVLPLSRRIASAALGAWEYVWTTIWPVALALLYPHPPAISWGLAGLAAFGLVLVTYLAIRLAERYPWLPVGWWWFLGTLVPVIGLVQVGSQRIADRYTYIPTIGLFVILAWGGAELARRVRIHRLVAAGLVLALVTAGGALAHAQAARWASSISIWEHTLAVTDGNARAHNHLGHALAASGRDADALRHYEDALRLHPDYPEALNNIGALLARHGDTGPAIAAFGRALELSPGLPHVRGNLGLALVHAGRPLEAIGHLEDAITRQPSNAELRRRLGVALALAGRHADAVDAFEAALALEPRDAVAHNALGAALAATGDTTGALRHYRTAAGLDPRLLEARTNLGRTLLAGGAGDEGKQVLYEVARELLEDGQLEPALQQLELVLRHDPAYQPARDVLETLAARSRRPPR